MLNMDVMSFVFKVLDKNVPALDRIIYLNNDGNDSAFDIIKAICIQIGITYESYNL